MNQHLNTRFEYLFEYSFIIRLKESYFDNSLSGLVKIWKWEVIDKTKNYALSKVTLIFGTRTLMEVMTFDPLKDPLFSLFR